ncbi:MAG: PIG-L family deacetylase [Bacteroidetes bacterium]|nr:PIG-L family deacetylase [Bacteroidota bacterium]
MKPGLVFFFVWMLAPWSAFSQQETLVVITPHPDDAEASCGGLIANSVAAGRQVVIVTLTGGEYGIGGKTPAEARDIREKEAVAAAGVLGARCEFFGACDAFLPVDTASTGRLTRLLLRLNPGVVLAPWPLDVHSDHQAAGLLAWRVFLDRKVSFSLYFYETGNTPHTKSFRFIPTDYVDITTVMELKKKALFQHASQQPETWWELYLNLAVVNGYACDAQFAEAYLRAGTFSGMGGRPGIVPKTLENRPDGKEN